MRINFEYDPRFTIILVFINIFSQIRHSQVIWLVFSGHFIIIQDFFKYK